MRDRTDRPCVRWPTLFAVVSTVLATSIGISWAALQEHSNHLHSGSVAVGEYHRTVDRLEQSLLRIDEKLDVLLARNARPMGSNLE